MCVYSYTSVQGILFRNLQLFNHGNHNIPIAFPRIPRSMLAPLQYLVTAFILRIDNLFSYPATRSDDVFASKWNPIWTTMMILLLAIALLQS